MPWTVNPAFQPGIIVSFHNNLSVLPGIDEAGLDGRVSINIAWGTRLSTTEVMVDLGLTHLTIPLDEKVLSKNSAQDEAMAVSLLCWITTGEEIPATECE